VVDTGEGVTAERTHLGPAFWVLAGASTIFFTAQGMLLPVLPQYVDRELDGGTLAVGIAVSSFALGAMVARPWGGAMADRTGRRIVGMLGSLLWASMVALYGVAGAVAGVGGLVVVRIIGGVGGGALFVAMTAIATDLAPARQRVRAFGLFSMSTLIGFAVGPAIGETVLDEDRFELTFVICAVLALAPLLALSVLPETKPVLDVVEPTAAHSTKRAPLLHPAARRPGVAMLLGSLGFVTYAAFVPLYSEEVGLSNVAIPLTVTAATNLLTRFAAAPMADKIDRRTLTSVSLIVIAAAASTLALFASPTGVVVAAILNGAGNAYLFPGFLAMTVDTAGEADRGRAIGSLTVFSDLANSVGGAVLGVAAAIAGYRGAFALAAVLALCSLVVLRVSIRPAPVEAETLRPA
jgi:MFS family permease